MLPCQVFETQSMTVVSLIWHLNGGGLHQSFWVPACHCRRASPLLWCNNTKPTATCPASLCQAQLNSSWAIIRCVSNYVATTCRPNVDWMCPVSGSVPVWTGPAQSSLRTFFSRADPRTNRCSCSKRQAITRGRRQVSIVRRASTKKQTTQKHGFAYGDSAAVVRCTFPDAGFLMLILESAPFWGKERTEVLPRALHNRRCCSVVANHCSGLVTFLGLYRICFFQIWREPDLARF